MDILFLDVEKKLSKVQYTVIKLRYVHQKQYDFIADVIGLSITRARQIEHKALRILRTRLGKRYITC
jgi:DNA-directed RNA polymerase sigma subunit (sigma70/sigma32)